MAGGIYTSTYKRHYTWPPHIPRKTASVENPSYPDLCGHGEREVCEARVCLCQPPERRKPQEELPECEGENSWRYLLGVKSLYGESYDKPVQLQPLKRKHRGPDVAMENFDPPKSDFPNPFLVGKEIFRPGLPRTLQGTGCPNGWDVEPRETIIEPKMKELELALAFPQELQDVIVRAKARADKISLGRARPKGVL